MKDKLKWILSYFLVFALVLQMGPIEVLATDINDAEAETVDVVSTTETDVVEEEAASDIYITGEVEDLRDEYEKHYHLSDGSYVAAYFQVPVHYEDNGEWVDIDNTLQAVAMYDGTEVYQSVNGDNAQAFASTLMDGTIMSVSQDNTSITMSLWDGGIVEETEIDSESADETDVTETAVDVPAEPVTEETEEEPSIETTTETIIDPTEDAADSEEQLAADENVESAAVGSDNVEPDSTDGTATEETAADEVAVHEEEVEQERTETPVTDETTDDTENEENTEETEEENAVTLPEYNREAVAQIISGNDAVALATVEDETTLRDATDVMPDTLSNTVLYEDVYPNVDLQYDTFGYNVKESIILNAPANQAVEVDVSENAVAATAPYIYTFLLSLDGLTPEMQGDGSILLLDDNGEMEYTIPAPYMEDSNEAYSEDVWYTLEEIEQGWLLTVEADAQWLEDDSRVYPVTIDPTIISKKNESNFVGATAAENSASSEVSSTQMAVGYHDTHGEMRGYFTINNMPALDPGCTVVNASIGLRLTDYIPRWNSSAKMVMSIHEITTIPTSDTWLDDLTWENKPAYSEALDYQNVHGGTLQVYFYWDVTRAAKEYYEGSTDELGFVLTSDQTADTAYRAWFKYADYAVLTVTYRNTAGTESYYTYETQSASRAGSGYVGDYSSALTVAKSDLSYSNTAMGFSLGHIYNSGLRAGNLSDDALSTIIAPDYSGMKMGYGWQLNVQESVYRTKISDTTYLVYRDSDGTQHYFTYNSSKDQYEDEDGLGITIYVPDSTSGTNKIYEWSDQEGNEKYFYNGYLMYTKDGNGNMICYLYNGASYSSTLSSWYPPESGAYLTSIVSVNKGQDGSTICTLSYTDGYLTSITDYAERTTTYSYSSGKLTSITHPDGTVVYYTYNSDNHFTSMYDGEAQYGIEYGYQGDGVASIKEYTASSNTATKTYGAKVQRSKNGVQEAVYTYDGDDRTFGTSDDIVTRYAFDYVGRTINATTLDNDESEILGVTAAAYTENSGTENTNNRVEKDAQSGQNGMNLLTAGGLESHDSFTTASSKWTVLQSAATGRSASVTTSGTARTGSGAITVTLQSTATADSSGNRKMGMYQDVSLTAGTTYTFSAYVNSQSVTSFGTSGGLYAAFLNTSNTILASGLKVESATNSQIEDGWQRVYATYTPTTSGTYRVAVIQENAYGTSYFDDLQLEAGSAPSNTNLLQNGSFNGSTEWTIGDYSTASGDSLHSDVITATGATATMKRGSQTVPINGPATDTYLLSGWAKAASVADTETELTDSTAESNTSSRYFGLIARVDYTDDTKEYFYMPFNDDYNGWQYASCVIAPKESNQSKTIESITVITAYDCNANTVWFDNISLRQEPCTTYTYDSEGNVTAVNATGNSSADFTYTSGTTKLTKSVTEDSGTYEYEYTDSNNDHLVTKIKNDGVSMDITYDAYGNSTTTTLSSDSDSSVGSIKTSATYSSDGSQLLTQTSSSGYTTTYTYDSYRRITGIEDNAGTLTQNRYTNSNDRISMTYQSGVVSTHFYYTAGMLTSVIRGGYIPGNDVKQNQTYSMAYDRFGNMTGVAVGNRTLATYQYSSNNGNLQSMTYGNGAVVSYTYDNLDRVTHEYWNGTLKYEYVYNAEGNLAKKLDVDSKKTVNYEYDSLGRLIHSYQTAEDTAGNTVILQKTEHLYDTENRIISQNWQLGDTVYAESYTYNTDDGSLASMTPAAGGQITFEYDALKRLSSRTNSVYSLNYLYSSVMSEEVTEYQPTTQVWNLCYLKVNDNNIEEFGLNYYYDDVGNIESTADSGRTDYPTRYTYDQQGQLLTERNSWRDYSCTYTYDSYGNIRSVSGDESHTYTYGDSDWLDLLTAYDGETITYDAIGNPLSYYNGTRWTFTWQNGRQLAAAESSDASVSYTYDVAGIRDSKTVTTSEGTVTYNYLTQNGQVVRQTWTEDGTDHVIEFIYDNNGRPYAFICDGTAYYYLLTLQGDVIRIVDSAGTTVAEYEYNAWGEVIYSSGTMVDVNPIRYRGYYYDSETGLYYLQSRYYDPVIKRFINADSFASTGDSLLGFNMFVYCYNNPTRYSDNGGKLPDDKLLENAAIYNMGGNIAMCGWNNNHNTYSINNEKDVLVYPSGFTAPESKSSNRNNIIVYDKRNGTSNPNMKVMNSASVTSRIEMLEITEVLLKHDEMYPSEVEWGRTWGSLIIEWELHNWAYEKNIKPENTKDVDFDLNDEGVGFWEFAYSRFFEPLMGKLYNYINS